VISPHFLLSVIIPDLPQCKLAIQLYASHCRRWQGREGYEVIGSEALCSDRESSLMAYQQVLLSASCARKLDLGCYSFQMSLLL